MQPNDYRKSKTYPPKTKWTKGAIAFVIAHNIDNDSSDEAKKIFMKVLKNEFGISRQWKGLWTLIQKYRKLIPLMKEGPPIKTARIRRGSQAALQLSKNE